MIRQWRRLRGRESIRYGRTVTESAEEDSELGSVRPICRDREALEPAGFSFYQNEDPRWRLLSPSGAGPAVLIQLAETLALLVPEQEMRPHQHPWNRLTQGGRCD